jgi:hypothetical protein
MIKKILVLFVALVLVMGWTTSDLRAAQMPAEGKGVPVIVQSFASKELRAGDVWKVYLKASDPEGKMKYIFATISQPGVGTYPVSILRIKREDQKEFSGYIYLNTAPAPPSEFFNLTFTLAVNIQGKGGVFSEPAFFPLSFSPKRVREAPPEGVFKEQNLGPIMINLRTVSEGSAEEH